MWGTDRTATYTRQEGQVAIVVAVEHDSAAWVGIQAARHGTRCEAVEPIRQGVRTSFGMFGQDSAQGVLLRHEHGSQSLSQVLQEALRFLGITSAPACVRDPAGNGCAARFPRTLTEYLCWLATFDTVAELRLVLQRTFILVDCIALFGAGDGRQRPHGSAAAQRR
jgi:hypothetical protein